MATFPTPQGGASFILSFRLQSRTTVVLGSGSLAASRAFSALEADSTVTVIAEGGLPAACEELQWRAQQNQLTLLDWNALSQSSSGEEDDGFDSYIAAMKDVSFVCVTDTARGEARPRSRASAARIYRFCRSRNIPVNTTDMPEFCDFSFTAMHRFAGSAPDVRSALQIGVTTNGKGCRLASRVRRDIVGLLPKEVGAAVDKISAIRRLVTSDSVEDETYEDSGVSTPNRPVPSRSPTETEAEAATRRMKWIAQVSEYWPLSKLASMSDEEMLDILAEEHSTSPAALSALLQSLDVRRKGRILLVGSGPGHPSLLTVAAHTALTKLADVVLSDKLVPSAVLDLIPQTVQVRIAKKFPGNSEGAQSEMMAAAVEAANRGLTVIRLKQGDPVVYGRAGEEVLYFRAHGFEPVVVPGVSSALAGPTFAGIPVTQRGVAETLTVCTGVGRGGKDVQLPAYARARTLVVLMGVARLPQVVAALRDPARVGVVYPPCMPIAIVERASMPDQRVVVSTLRDVVAALDSAGEQRPPGIMVIGWSVLALWGTGDIEVLEDGAEKDDEARVARWLGQGVGWRVKEGLPDGWGDL
ncbi:uroporphyrin-III C-methyltransferase [Mycena pura]|uniref:precorrin-2 dehydrogenase n=1 Tax=Mycena pura TaxID=153505 RepID=A0AAD6V142_9AGAR|nr:uroporphyrin-III C-methyltransferase [Mycena pura]